MEFNETTARLLSTENLTVIQDNVKTASFDVENRTLVVPVMDDRAYDILIPHEVGHALFTTQEFNEVFKSCSPIMRQYYNIIEDVRIEKLIKRTYPGFRKTMADGYEYINSINFIVPDNVKVCELNTIDRINVYFKCGLIYSVGFNEIEFEFVQRAAKCETIHEVIKLAEDIFEYSSQNETHKIPNSTSEHNSESDETESDETESDESDSELDESTSDESIHPNQEFIEDSLESITYDRIQSGIDSTVKLNRSVENFTLETEFNHDPIVKYDSIIKIVENHVYFEQIKFDIKKCSNKYDEFIHNATRVVNYMVKEFEMQKSASQIKHAKTSKSGRINTNKLFSYKFNDNLFKSVTLTQDSKNHGMVFLVDWSGSMRSNITSVLEQVLTLSMFCRKVKIPFKVLAFSSVWNIHNIIDELTKSNSCPNGTVISGAGVVFNLFEFLNDSMSSHDFEYISRLFFTNYLFRIFQLQSTPLDSALIYMRYFLPKFKREHGIENLTFVILSDGESDSPFFKEANTFSQFNRSNSRRNLIDPITKSNIMFSDIGMTKSLLKIIKSTVSCNIVGLFLCDKFNSRKVVVKSLPDMSPNFYDKVILDLNSNNYVKFDNLNYDDFYLMKSVNKSVKSVAYSDDMTANQLSKIMNSKLNIDMAQQNIMKLIIKNFA